MWTKLLSDLISTSCIFQVPYWKFRLNIPLDYSKHESTRFYLSTWLRPHSLVLSLACLVPFFFFFILFFFFSFFYIHTLQVYEYIYTCTTYLPLTLSVCQRPQRHDLQVNDKLMEVISVYISMHLTKVFFNILFSFFIYYNSFVLYIEPKRFC